MRFLILLFSFLVFSCTSNAQQKTKKKKETYKVTKTDKEWKTQLTQKQYFVLRQAGTERAFTGEYNKHYKKGVYQCAACKTPLYASNHKFDSGTGWPSFDQEIKENVAFDVDYKIGYKRVELLCATCGGHLGHMFADGPSETTGQRHCLNSASLTFIPSTN